MVAEQELFWGLSVGMIFVAGIADILFLWILHYTSTRYPRPNDNGKWNELDINNDHDCCHECCNDDLSRCFCGLRCRKIMCPVRCNCCYPLELFVPFYPRSFFTTLQPDIDDDDSDDENIRDLELKTLENGDESKKDETEEVKDAEFGDPMDEHITFKRRRSSLAQIEESANLRILHDRYGKCCCCSCCSIIWKIWFLICGILSFVIFIIFSFTMFFEFWVKCTTLKNGQFLGFIVAIFIVSKIFIWFLYHSFQACWLLAYNTCDANDILIVEWWRFWQIFWCIMFAVIYLVTVDPESINNALIGQSIARFMVIQGIVWIVIYWIAVLISSIWLILNLFEWTKGDIMQKCQNCLNPYKWKWIKQNSLCMKYCDDYAQHLMIFENQKCSQYKLTLLDFLSGLRPYSLGNKYDIKYINYFQYFWVGFLIICGIIFIIVGYIMCSGYELMVFSGWSFLIYYVLIILIKKDDFDGIIFKMWNGFSYKKIYYLLKEVRDKHHDNYYYSYLANTITGCDVIILRYVDIWSMYYHADSPNFWSLFCSIQNCAICCCTKNRKDDENDDNDESDGIKQQYSMWQLKEFNAQTWVTIAILIIPFSILIWASRTVDEAQGRIIEYDKVSVSKWNWTTEALGKNQYPFCHTTQINNYLNAFDLIYLCQSGWYFEDSDVLETSFRSWFGINDTETGWNYNSTLVNFVTEGYEPTVYYIENIKYKIDLVVIRGSYTKEDWLQDANLWSEAIIIQLISMIIPINNIFDDVFLRDLVYISSGFQGLIFPELRNRYDQPIYDFIIKYVIPRNTGNIILITGHSLGAGVAEIVASRLHSDGYGRNVIGFGLSPPGTLWSSKKFGYNFNDLDVSVLTVQPRRDPVPMIDKQAGMIQYIDCNAYKAWSCHSAIRTMCQLYHSCGDDGENNKIKNVDFVECLCIDANDWNQCTNITLNDTLTTS